MLNQKGFTLIELMISILIGLIITAAVAQVYVMGVRNASIQQAASGVLDANVFGLQQIERNLRMAGLGLGETSQLNKDCGGVIISSGTNRLNCDGTPAADAEKADIYAVKLGGLRGGQGLPLDLRTKTDGGPSNTSNGNTTQLTIQYRAPVDMRDCEGRLALGPRTIQRGYLDGRHLENSDEETEKQGEPITIDGQVVIERYFVKRNTEGALELRCDAGRYVLEHILVGSQDKPADAEILGVNSPIQGMGDDGSLVIAGIDDFQVQFGVKDGQNMRYTNVAEYLNGNIAGEIATIKLGILAKGTVAISQADAPDNPTYVLFGQNITMQADQPNNAIRRVYETTTMLRNSRYEVQQ